MASLNLYAVPAYKGVELRWAAKPPKKVITKVKRMGFSHRCVEIDRGRDFIPHRDEITRRWMYRFDIMYAPVPYVLKSTTWHGGRLMRVLSSKEFKSLVGFAPEMKSVTLIPPALYGLFRKPK